MRGLLLVCCVAFATGELCEGQAYEGPDRVILLQEKKSRLLMSKDGALVDVNDTDPANMNVFKRKALLNIVDIQKAEDEFRVSSKPLLVDGEVVDMAFFDGYRDWVLFTNMRLIQVDGQTSWLTGWGKARSNKVTYSSKLWHLFQLETVDRRGRDVAVTLLPMGLELEFTKSIGDDKLFEIGAYIAEKVKSSWPRRTQLLDHADTASAWFEGGVPTLLERCQPTTTSLEGILGSGRSMIGNDENVLYQFHETKGVYRDQMIVTDKQVLVEKKAGSEAEFNAYPFPQFPDNFDAWKFIGSWSITTAARRGWDRDSEGEATAYFGFSPGFGAKYSSKTMSLSFDKRYVNTDKLFEYHSKLQEKVTKAWGFTQVN